MGMQVANTSSFVDATGQTELFALTRLMGVEPRFGPHGNASLSELLRMLDEDSSIIAKDPVQWGLRVDDRFPSRKNRENRYFLTESWITDYLGTEVKHYNDLWGRNGVFVRVLAQKPPSMRHLEEIRSILHVAVGLRGQQGYYPRMTEAMRETLDVVKQHIKRVALESQLDLAERGLKVCKHCAGVFSEPPPFDAPVS